MRHPTEDLPFVSVVVPTLNRKKYLEACLKSLLDLDYPKSMLEIIVVDGGSSDGTGLMLMENFRNCKIIFERRDGISFARNSGGEIARGEIIAFTDDDCVVDKNWLKNLMTAFKDETIAAAGGPNFLLHPDLFPTKFINSPTLGVFSLGNEKCSVEFLITANFAIRTDLFKNIKFDVLFGRRQTSIYKWEEDVELCLRLINLGYKLIYVPTAKVYHNISPVRIRLKYVIEKELSGGLSHYMVERRYKSKILICVTSIRSLVVLTAVFYKRRSISSFCWLLKSIAMSIASIFLP